MNDPEEDGRWSDETLMDFLTVSNDQLIRDIRFPEARFTTNTIPFVQAYQMPEIIEPTRLYVGGRIAIPTDRDTLEEVQTGDWDQSSQLEGGLPPLTGSAAPVGTTGCFAPQWTVATPAAFPAANSFNSFCWPAPETLGWSCGMRPKWFVDSGYIVIIPTPNAAPPLDALGNPTSNIELRALIPPDPITDINQVLWFPRSCVSPLAWHVVLQCAFSDATQITADQRNFAQQEFEKEKNQRRQDVALLFEAHGQNGIKFDTQRRYQQGRKVLRGGSI